MAFACNARIGGNQIKDVKKLIMIFSRLCGTEQAHTFFGNADNVVFGLEGKAKAHSQ